jgi:hypothetical protein
MPLSIRRSFTRGTPRGLFGRNGLMAGPFTIGEFVAHDSGLRFGSLNHALGGTIKPLRLVEADTNPGLTSAFGGTADMGDLLLGLSPVENDPNRLGQQYRRTKPRRQYERDEHIRSHG